MRSCCYFLKYFGNISKGFYMIYLLCGYFLIIKLNILNK